MTAADLCPLCREPGGQLVARTPNLRVVLVDDHDYYPGFVRVIWNAHAAEMSDLAADERAQLMAAVLVVETSLRQILAPKKINLASLGNQVPHLHWHVIARFSDDAHFPQPVWSARLREPGDALRLRLGACASSLAACIARNLACA